MKLGQGYIGVFDSVHRGAWGVWQGGVHGWGACMAGGVCGGGCAWQGGMHAGGHEWQGGGMHGMGACMICTPQADTMAMAYGNERAVRILLECILV